MAAIIDQYSEQELRDIIKNSKSYAEVLKKLGYSSTHGDNNATLKKRIEAYGIDISHFSPYNGTKRSEENVFVENSTASQATLRRWYIKGEYTPYICSICGQEPLWQGKELTLILDHINGINNDDRLENLRWVCPNCNQQLDTTGFKKMRVEQVASSQKKFYCAECGKEITKYSNSGLCADCASKNRRVCERPPREELKEMIRTRTFTEIGKLYGVADNTVRKWCDSYQLPRRKTEINQINDTEWEQI